MAQTAVELGIGHLTRNGFRYEKVFVCGRVTQGQTVSEFDTTLLIYVSIEERHDQLVSVLDDLIQALCGLDFRGRVEMIDPRAIQGPMTFPPSLTQQQRQRSNWDRIQTHVIESLGRLNVDWRQIFLADRGYWREVSKTTVIIKAEISGSTAISQLTEDLEGSGFELEVKGTKGLWGLFGGLAAAVDDQNVRLSLGWPFPPTLHGMGISVSRTFESTSGTLGGYLQISHNGVEHVVGLTCYHCVRMDEQGNADLSKSSLF